MQLPLNFRLALVAMTSLLSFPATADGEPEFFRPLGTGTEAWGMSGDGRTVVGRRQTEDGWEAFLWKDGEIIGLGDFPGGEFSSKATAASADGSVVVGVATTETGFEAFRWTRQTGLVSLGKGVASDVSSDGSIVVGLDQGNEVFWWSTDHGRQPIPFLQSTAEPKISDDGAIVGGQRFNKVIAYHLGTPGTFPFDNPTEHIRSTNSRDSVFVGISGDGNTLVGTTHFNDIDWAFDLSLTFGSGILYHGHVTDVAYFGWTTIGNPGPLQTNYDDALISDELGLDEIRTRLVEAGVAGSLAGWPRLGLGTAISSSGRVVAGWHATQGAWIARIAIPEPTTLFLAGACFSAMLCHAGHRPAKLTTLVYPSPAARSTRSEARRMTNKEHF
jgi:probable HAF family extracellular repeat protein